MAYTAQKANQKSDNEDNHQKSGAESTDVSSSVSKEDRLETESTDASSSVSKEDRLETKSIDSSDSFSFEKYQPNLWGCYSDIQEWYDDCSMIEDNEENEDMYRPSDLKTMVDQVTKQDPATLKTTK